MQCKGMMKDSLTCFCFNRYWFKFFPLFWCKIIFDSHKVPRKLGFLKQSPAMTAGNILQATILFGRIIEAAPACQMCYRLGPCPIRVILVPCNYATFFWRLAEQLVVPKTYR